jgi:hypothetical protein
MRKAIILNSRVNWIVVEQEHLQDFQDVLLAIADTIPQGSIVYPDKLVHIRKSPDTVETSTYLLSLTNQQIADFKALTDTNSDALAYWSLLDSLDSLPKEKSNDITIFLLDNSIIDQQTYDKLILVDYTTEYNYSGDVINEYSEIKTSQ